MTQPPSLSSRLKPASQMAQQNGVKCLMYGCAGTGKTPLIGTCPRPVAVMTEAGALSVRNQNFPCFQAFTGKEIMEFFDWAHRSNETKNYDTIAVDSLSQLAEIILKEELKQNKDGRKAYGEMARAVMHIAETLFFMPKKHIYLISKLVEEKDEKGVMTKRPLFPGNKLTADLPHLFDEFWYIGKQQVPGQPQPVLAIRTKETFGIVARDRSGKLQELEQPHLGNLFNKCMS